MKKKLRFANNDLKKLINHFTVDELSHFCADSFRPANASNQLYRYMKKLENENLVEEDGLSLAESLAAEIIDFADKYGERLYKISREFDRVQSKII